MFQVSALSKRFGEKLLFDGLTWQVGGLDRVGLVGPNGAGKSTLLGIIAGRVEADGGLVITAKGSRVGLLSQDLTFDRDRTVMAEVLSGTDELNQVRAELERVERLLEGSDGLDAAVNEYGALRERFEVLGGDHVEVDARRILGGLGFDQAASGRPVASFSGGWRMRVALARLLLSRPRVLLLDEPTNHLDLESVAWLEEYLRSYPGAVVVVSHDRTFLNRAVNRIAELGPGGVKVYPGGYDNWLIEREKERALEEKRAEEQAAEIERIERFIERFRAKATKAAAVQSRVKQLEKIERMELAPASKVIGGFRFPQPPRSGRTVAALSGVRKAYGDNVVYAGLDLSIERGQRIALVGVNGAGKSTLLRILAGVLPVEAGKVVLGHNVTVGYYAQHQLEMLDPQHSVLDSMADVADIETYPLIRGILGGFLFSGNDVEKPIAVLSGGEKARVALGRLLLRPVTLLLMDEPTNHLDLDSRRALEDALCRYDGTLVVVSHDRWFMNAVCTHVLEVGREDGRSTVTWTLGNYDEYLAKKALEAVPAQGPARVGESDDDKARKRREAEERQRVHQATKGLKAELERVEKRIEADEAALGALDAELADPAVYEQGRAAELLRRRPTIEAAIEAAYAQWADVEAKITAATAAAKR